MDIKDAIAAIDEKLVELVENAVLAPDVNAHLCIAGNHLMLALLALTASAEEEKKLLALAAEKSES